ncbi:hypothetical protein ACQEVY_29555 [Streptomyces sp. CA-288835]|uniref:hypothetical protein n=1 Tax=Streptomyces sp. CA-288835 TaxID=3240069 RepID=UPI003D936BF6
MTSVGFGIGIGIGGFISALLVKPVGDDGLIEQSTVGRRDTAGRTSFVRIYADRTRNRPGFAPPAEA